MVKEIEIIFVDRGIKAIAKLLEDEAPKTCEILWKCFERPIECEAHSQMWLGNCLHFPIPPEFRNFKGEDIPRENADCFPKPGDLEWGWNRYGSERGFANEWYHLFYVWGGYPPYQSNRFCSG